MEDRNEQRVGARTNEARPAIGRAPIPMFGRAHVPERVVLRRASVDLLGVNHEELETRQKHQAQEQAMTLPKLSTHRETHHSESWTGATLPIFPQDENVLVSNGNRFLDDKRCEIRPGPWGYGRA